MSLLKNDLTKLFLYLILSFTLAAILTPFLYGWGKDLAAYAVANETNSFIEWLGEKCGRAKFDRYFKRALLLMGLILLYPLAKFIRREKPIAKRTRKKFKYSHHNGRDLLVGFILSTALFVVMAMLAWHKNYFAFREGADVLKSIVKAAPAAVITSIIEEWLFRGVILTLLLKNLSPKKAIIGSSVLFAVVHFAQPPHGLQVPDPRAFFAGFLFLGEVFETLLTPLNIVANLATLIAIGVILAMVTYKTGKLWAAIGLHAGWILVYHAFTRLFMANPAHSNSYLMGQTLKEGLLPLAILAITAGCMLVYIRKFHAQKPPESPA